VAVQYYTPDQFDFNYPTIIKAIVESLKVYTCKVLYPLEEYRLSQNRFILTDFAGGDDASIRRSIEQFRNSQAEFPFTAYGIWDNERLVDAGVHKEKSGTYYSKIYGCYVKSVPARITIPMVSFFSTAADYERAFQLLDSESAILIRLFIPISINENITYFPIDLNMEVTKGSFAGEFDTYLHTGNIWGVNHNFTISFRYFYVNANDQHGNTPRIALVDDIITSFYSYNNLDHRDNPTLQGVTHSYDVPIVTSSIPVDKATNVSRANPITLNFNTAMDENSVFSNFSSTPFITANFDWDITQKQLSIDIVEPLSASTNYVISISKDVQSAMEQNMDEDFILSFTTGL
jgi:hypothetical protein